MLLYIGVVVPLVVLSRLLLGIGHAVCNFHTALTTTEYFRGEIFSFLIIVEFIYEKKI